MKLLIVFSMCLLAVSTTVPLAELYEDLKALDPKENRLFLSVTNADYETAVVQIMDIAKTSDAAYSITGVVLTLIVRGNRNLINFAYKLWVRNEDIVRKYFPIQFRQMFSGEKVKFINKRHNLAIKLGDVTDDLNDRTAFGDVDDNTGERISWQMKPVWDANQVYFKIFSVPRNQYLKLGTAADDAGDHVAYGSDAADTNRHHWYLVPVRSLGYTVFFIYNRQYDQALMLDNATEHAGKRQVYSHPPSLLDKRDVFGWFIYPTN